MNSYTSSIAVALLSFATFTLSSHATAAGYGGGMSDMSDKGMNDGAITIIAPEQGQTFTSGSGIELQYKVQFSPRGNHLHVYVDNSNPIIVRKVSGCPCSVKLPELAPGMHMVRVKEATSSHALTSVESDVSFTVVK